MAGTVEPRWCRGGAGWSNGQPLLVGPCLLDLQDWRLACGCGQPQAMQSLLNTYVPLGRPNLRGTSLLPRP